MHKLTSIGILQSQLNLLGVFLACAENSQEFDESKVERRPGGRFGSKPTSAPNSVPAEPNPKIPPGLLEKKRQLDDKVEEITRSVREAIFGVDAIAQLQSLSGSFKKSLDQNKIFRHAQMVTQKIQAQDSLERSLESAISQYRDLVEQVKKGKQPEEIAGTVSATSSAIGGIVGNLHGGESLSKVSEMLKQKQTVLNLEDIASKWKPSDVRHDTSEVVGLLKNKAVDLINATVAGNKCLI